MKKYSIGFVALVLAVSFSAFENKPESKESSNLYWYDFDPSTQQINLLPDNQNIARSEADAMDQTGCVEIPQVTICAKAYSTQQTGLPKTAPANPQDQLYIP